MIYKYLKYIGLKKDKGTSHSLEQKNSTSEKYRPTTRLKVAERHLTYLKEIYNYQRDRRTNIENKNSQLVVQAAIVSSISAFFILLLIEKLNDAASWIKIFLSVLFLIVMFHYILSILHAIKTLEINKYRYPIFSTKSVTKTDKEKNELAFVNSEIKDLVFIINKTTEIDNIKSNNLIFSVRCFKIGTIAFGIMTLSLIVLTYI